MKPVKNPLSKNTQKQKLVPAPKSSGNNKVHITLVSIGQAQSIGAISFLN